MTHYDAILQRQGQDEQRALEAAAERVMQTPEGRRLYRHIVRAGMLFAPAPSGEQRAEWIGRRALALDLFNLFQVAAPTLCGLAASEGRTEQAARDAELEQAASLDEKETSGFSLEKFVENNQNMNSNGN